MQALFLSSVLVPSLPHLALPYHAMPNAAVAAPPQWLETHAGSETSPRTDDFSIGVGVGFVPGSVGGSGGSGSGSFGRKRVRTKFTPEQKERMREFAEKQGWRIQRNDDGALDRFCDEIGVKRQVLKVWMHNHKNQLASTSTTAAGIGTPAPAPPVRCFTGGQALVLPPRALACHSQLRRDDALWFAW